MKCNEIVCEILALFILKIETDPTNKQAIKKFDFRSTNVEQSK